jgi:hypothetical protein
MNRMPNQEETGVPDNVGTQQPRKNRHYNSESVLLEADEAPAEIAERHSARMIFAAERDHARTVHHHG